MIDSKILISVVIVLLIGVVAAGYQVSKTPGFWQPVASNNPDSYKESGLDGTDSVSQQSSGSSPSTSLSQQQSGSGIDYVKISSSEAQSIAQKSIVQEGAVAGTPNLINSYGQKIYVVPIFMNGNQVGEIYIDPQTGKNLGGAGGAP